MNATKNGTTGHLPRINISGQPQTRRQAARPRIKADQVLYWSAVGAPWGLAVLLLGVSMPHLSDGFQRITGCGALAGWLLAIAIDAAQVAAKLQLTLGHRFSVGGPAKWTAGGIVGATGLTSAALNVLAFLTGASTITGYVLAVFTGVMLPALILALSYTGSCFALAKARRAERAPAKRRGK